MCKASFSGGRPHLTILKVEFVGWVLGALQWEFCNAIREEATIKGFRCSSDSQLHQILANTRPEHRGNQNAKLLPNVIEHYNVGGIFFWGGNALLEKLIAFGIHTQPAGSNKRPGTSPRILSLEICTAMVYAHGH